MDFDDNTFPNNDPNLVARGVLSDGTVWHHFRSDDRNTFRFEYPGGGTRYVDISGEQMTLIAARTYNS